MTEKKTAQVEKPARVLRTPQERAQEQVDSLMARLNRLVARKVAFEADAAAMMPEIEACRKRLEYAQRSPDLEPVATQVQDPEMP